MKHNFKLNLSFLKGLLAILFFLSTISNAQCWQSTSNKAAHVMAIKSNGTLWGWGGNQNGQLGDGTLVNKNVPTQIGSGTNWLSVAAGLNHTIAVKTDGTLWAWGQNYFGQLGDGTNTDKSTPTQIGTATNWKSVSTGFNHSLAIKTDGTIWAWGNNGLNQLGDGTSVDKNTPTQVGTATNWKTISAGGWFNLAQKLDGTLWAWGSNIYGQLGDGTTVNKTTPTQIGTATDWEIIVGGGWHSFAKKTNGTIWGWGFNNYGQLGDGTNISKSSPTQIGTSTNWLYISPGSEHTFGIKTDGTLWAWGRNQYGQFGNGIISMTNSPAQIGTNTWQAVVAGASLTIATGCDGTLWSTGYNPYGQLGNGTTNVNSSNFVVTSPCPMVIDAINDDYSSNPILYGSGGTMASVLVNDKGNGSALSNSCVTLTLTNNGGLTGVTMNNLGIITVPNTANIGNYTLTYQVCQNSVPTNCDSATVIISVIDPTNQTPNLVSATRANNGVELLGIQSGGKIIIGGQFSTYNNISAIAIARLNTDLTLDTTFTSTGPTPAYDMKLQSDNKIVLVGNFNTFNGGSNGNGIVRLNPNGTVDTGFNVAGAGFTGMGKISTRSCAIQPNGKILVGGSFLATYNGVAVRNMVRLNSDGSLDSSFTYPYTTASGLYGAIFRIVVQPDGKILIAGNKSGLAGGQQNLMRLKSDGSIDASFTTGDTGTNMFPANCGSCANSIQNMLLLPDGKILVVGVFDSYNGNTNYKNIVRLNVDGTIDTTFNGIGTSSNKAIKDVDYNQANDKIFIAGEFTSYNGYTINRIARLSSNGTLDPSFSPGSGPAGSITTVYNIERQIDGKVIVGGIFTTYNGIPATNITRIQPSIAGSQSRGGIQYYESEPEIDINNRIDNVDVYPNPSHNIFNIDLSKNVNNYTDIEIFNVLGAMVFKEKLTPKSLNSIDLSQMESGYYIAKIFNQNDSRQFKLVKK